MALADPSLIALLTVITVVSKNLSISFPYFAYKLGYVNAAMKDRRAIVEKENRRPKIESM